MQSTTLKRGPEERKVTLYKNGSAFLITCEVLASNFHKEGHSEVLYTPDLSLIHI